MVRIALSNTLVQAVRHFDHDALGVSVESRQDNFG
jgi:hypothetical protein